MTTTKDIAKHFITSALRSGEQTDASVQLRVESMGCGESYEDAVGELLDAGVIVSSIIPFETAIIGQFRFVATLRMAN